MVGGALAGASVDREGLGVGPRGVGLLAAIADVAALLHRASVVQQEARRPRRRGAIALVKWLDGQPWWRTADQDYPSRSLSD